MTGLFFVTDPDVPAGDYVRGPILFPVPAPQALNSGQATFGLGQGGAGPTSAQIAVIVANPEEDPAYTGNAGAPTAPAGKLCVYIGGTTFTNVAADSMIVAPGTSDASTAYERRMGGVVRATAKATGEVDVRGSWAYTAP